MRILPSCSRRTSRSAPLWNPDEVGGQEAGPISCLDRTLFRGFPPLKLPHPPAEQMPVAEIERPAKAKGIYMSLGFSPDGNLLACGDNQACPHAHLPGLDPARCPSPSSSPPDDAAAHAFALSVRDARHLVALLTLTPLLSSFPPETSHPLPSSHQGTVYIWCAKGASWALVQTIFAQHSGDIVTCIFNPRRGEAWTLLSASHDATVKFWSPHLAPASFEGAAMPAASIKDKWELVQTLQSGHKGHIGCASYARSPSHELLATGGGDSTIRVFCRKIGAQVWTVISSVAGHSGAVCGVAAAWTDEGGVQVVSASLDKTCKVWESPTAVDDNVTGVEFTESLFEGLQISAHGGDRRVAINPTDAGCVAVSSNKTVQVTSMLMLVHTSIRLKQAGQQDRPGSTYTRVMRYIYEAVHELARSSRGRMCDWSYVCKKLPKMWPPKHKPPPPLSPDSGPPPLKHRTGNSKP